jgi:altronate dehydratase
MVYKQVMIMDEKDNVAVALHPIGELVRVTLPSGRVILSAQAIPQAHKIAIQPIAKGEAVIRYGEKIGYATKDIAQGELVHVHNLDAVEGM